MSVPARRSGPPPETHRVAEARSLDLVQRLIISALVVIVVGAPTVALAAYSAAIHDARPGDSVGLWAMSVAVGLLGAVAVVIIHRRRAYSPWVLLGLLPAAVAAWLIWGPGT